MLMGVIAGKEECLFLLCEWIERFYVDVRDVVAFECGGYFWVVEMFE